MSNFFFCHYVFKKPSAAEASESVYMRDRVNNNIGSQAFKHVLISVKSSVESIVDRAKSALHAYKKPGQLSGRQRRRVVKYL